MTTQLQCQPIKDSIGAIITGVDLNELNDEILADIKQALLKHQVIFFRNQNLQTPSQVALAKSFGSLHIHPVFPTIDGIPEVIVLDSHETDLRDNELWHTDVTFSKTPPLGCVLRAVKIPPTGGDTFWASGTAAFAALPSDIQEKIKPLTAMHDIRLSFPKERFGGVSEEERQKLEEIYRKNPPVSHPVVRTHPETGEPILFVSEGFTSHINELPEDEGKKLLDFLTQHATKEEFHLRWQWQEGDVAIWDNRCTQHKALFDYGDAHRIMHRATINGDEPYFAA
ncbi:taurine dioxygenase [Moraxella cuniculi DSM 21768]|uniref:Taurine dioxygenase n=1 Tax=Moraxella cuniculi DSM 21768 TaxID=1122245 RepID=A0A1N7FDK0_9GAMM|nr:taurine dioxygenase [Moraxella cuniculi]OOS07117.1 taurine dioxygenase [Moraxella cuniculi]SIR98402.1 taurine dioxygenase [Moraxella cuniculi DSM 21768]